jgi:uncharacterized protein (TIGR02118 family)
MTGVKVVVIYPHPTDEKAFEREWMEKHKPLVEEKLKGMTRFVATKVLGSPHGRVTAYRIAEAHFSNMSELNKCLGSEGGKEVLAHAAAMSSGGAPIILLCEEESFIYW